MEVPNVRVCDLLALSGKLRREMVDQTHTQNKVPAVGAALVTLPEMPVEFVTPLREIEVVRARSVRHQSHFNIVEKAS